MLCVKGSREHIQGLYDAGLYKSAEILGTILPRQRVATVTSLYYLGSALHQIGHYSHALEKLNHALLSFSEKEPLHSNITEQDIRWTIYECCIALCDYEGALNVLEGISIKIRTPKHNMALGNLYKQRGLERAAIGCYKEVLKSCPLALEAVEALLQLGLGSKEILGLTTETLMGRYDWLIDWVEGHSQMCSGDYSKAMMSYQHIIDTNGASGHLLSKVAVCFNNLGAYTEARVMFEKAYSEEPYYFGNAGTYASILAMQKDKGALEKFCMSITPDLKVEVLISHSYLAIVKSEHARGLMLAERALELSPRYIPALIVKGCAAMFGQQFTDAMVSFREVLNATPSCFEAHKGMVSSLLSLGRHKEAVIAAKESIKQCSGQARSFLLIAVATSQYPQDNTKLRDRAKDFYMKALSLDPGCEEAVCSLASLLIRENNAKEGLKFVKRFLVRGSSARAHTTAGECYAALQQYEYALHHYHLAISLDETYTAAVSGIQAIERGGEAHDASELEEASIEAEDSGMPPHFSLQWNL